MKILSPIEEWRYQKYLSMFGPLSSSEALQLAIESESIAKDCGPMDPAYFHFTQEELTMFKYAELLEKKGL